MLREASAGHGEALAGDAGATLAAGGKRLRPLLVLLCAGPRGGGGSGACRRRGRARPHGDACPRRRARQCAVAPGKAHRGGHRRSRTRGRDRRPALLPRFRPAGRAGDERAVALLAKASTALARGELAQRHDAFDVSISEERYLERCRLKTAKLFECACLMGRDEEALTRVWLTYRAGVSAPRRRARRQRAARANRQGARHRSARRHRDPARDRSLCGRSRASRWTFAPSTLPRPKPSATASPPPAPSTESAPALWGWSPTPKSGSTPPTFDPEQRQLWASLPTASFSATASA